MDWKNSVVFVSGTNRGVGKALLQALLDKGAKKIYAGARDVSGLAGLPANVVPVKLDITKPEEVEAAARLAGDVTVLINNAGVNKLTDFMAADAIEQAQVEINTNYFGTTRMCRAFAPILKKNAGQRGIVNVLSLLARVALPPMATLCASKAAALRMTEAMRAALHGDGIKVIAILPGPIDTDMSAHLEDHKDSPEFVAAAILASLDGDRDEVYVGGMAEGVSQALAADRQTILRQVGGIA